MRSHSWWTPAVSLVPLTSVAMALAMATGCLVDAGGEDEQVGESRHEGMSLNGMSLNGMSLNGMSLNGMSLNGMSLNGMSLNGMSLNGMSLNGMSLNGSQLTGVTSSGQHVSGADLVGATMQGALSDGGTLALRVDSAGRLGGSSSDVWAYGVSYAAGNGTWAPLCGTSGGAPVLAVALAGTWNEGIGAGGGSWSASSSFFTLGCRGAALAKCVELGYQPWRSVGGVSLRDHHQTCTRLLRADYCGNGQPGTYDGYQINLYDKVGVQADTESGYQWVFEARWSPSGALCANEFRALELVMSGAVPTCALARLDHACEAGGFGGGALVLEEYNAVGIEGLLDQIARQNPGTPVAEKVADALDELKRGFIALTDRHHPDRELALGDFEDAAGDLETAVDDDLLPGGYGLGLLNRVAGVSRHQAASAVAENACSPRDSRKLSDARNRLARGDASRADQLYRDAVGSYRDAVSLAEDAGGRACSLVPVDPGHSGPSGPHH